MFQSRVQVAFLFVLWAFYAQAELVPPSGKNVTLDFRARWEEVAPVHSARQQSDLEALRKFRILLVPGFLSDVVIQAGTLPGAKLTRLGEYFDDYLRFGTRNGLDIQRVPLASQDSVARNGKQVAEEILGSPKPVILIGHSKGGIDALEALIRYPETQEKVKFFLPVQAPFQGSPIPDCIQSNSLLAPSAKFLLKKLGGNETSLADLAMDARLTYNDRNQQKIQALLRRVPVLSFASQKEKVGWKFDTLLKPFRDLMLSQHKMPNDGLVPWQSAILKDSEYIYVGGVDHAVPVMHCSILAFNRDVFFKTILSMALDRI